ncbi:hypothetical protein HY227_02485 [Candidatus Wolfebacteria bacterium]|nr:hypothetical protein [Candidatus Wolfebacteria bacterium]
MASQYPKSSLEEQIKRSAQAAGAGDLPWRLLLFMVLIFGITVLVYFGIIFGYKPYLSSQIKKLDQEIAAQSKNIERDEPKALITLYSQLVNIQNLLNSHPMPSKVLEFFEKNTLQNVYYVSLNLSVPEKNAKIDGVAEDYDAVVKQLEIFRKAPEVKSVFLDDSRARDGGMVQFSLRLTFVDEIFK